MQYFYNKKYITINKINFVICNWFDIWYDIYFFKTNITHTDKLNFALDELNFARCKNGTSEDDE